MKAISITLGNNSYLLSLPAAAKFEIDKISGESSVVDLTQNDTEDALKITCRILAIMIEKTELCRRYMKYDARQIPTAEEIEEIVTMTMTVGDIRKLKDDMYEAVILGCGREIKDPDREVDLVLQELDQKKNSQTQKAEYLFMASQVGISQRDALFMPPGEFYDMYELWSRPYRKKGDE
jgi:hypothetical protein